MPETTNREDFEIGDDLTIANATRGNAGAERGFAEAPTATGSTLSRINQGLRDG